MNFFASTNRTAKKRLTFLALAAIFIVSTLLLYTHMQLTMSQTLTYNRREVIESFAMQLYYTSSIRQLRTMSLYDPYRSATGQIDLENFVNKTDVIDSVIIYNDKLGVFFTSNGRFSYSFDGRYGFQDHYAATLLSDPESQPILTPIRRLVGYDEYYSYLFFERTSIQSGALLLNINAQDHGPNLLAYVRNLFYIGLVFFGTLSLFALVQYLFSGNREKGEKSEITKKINSLRDGSLQQYFEVPILLIQADQPFGALCQDFMDTFPKAIAMDDSLGAIAVVPNCTTKLLGELTHYFADKTEAPIYFSKLCHSSQQFQSSILAIEELRRLRFLYPDCQFMHETVLQECSAVSTLDTKSASSMIAYLREGKLEPAILEWQRIFENIRTDRFASLCFSIQYIEKQLDMLCDDLNLEKSDLCDKMLHTIRSVPLIHVYVEELFNSITRSTSLIKSKKIESLAYKVNEYIREHYSEESLSSQEIADYLEVNLSYLRQQYRKASNMSVSDAIHQERIKKARQLLRSTDEPVEMIAKHCGYSNTKYFFVIFKKYEGVTPKQFRKTSQDPAYHLLPTESGL